MRKLLLFLILLLIGMLGVSNATLWDRGGGLVYDDVLEITWLQDANHSAADVCIPGDSCPDGLMTWYSANAWASGLEYYDSVRGVIWDDWRLPSAYNQDGSGPDSGWNISSSEMGHMYYNNLGGTCGGTCGGGGFPGATFTDGYGNTVSFQDLQQNGYWASPKFDHEEYMATYAWYFYFTTGYQHYGTPGATLYAWAVRDGDVGAAPIPSALWLLGSGLIGIVGIRRKIKQ